MTTRPGFVWDNTALEWVSIGPVALPGSTVFYQSSAPSSPATGDIWVDADDEVPGITSSLNYRWRRIATGGETSLSGNDSSGLPLAYNPGYEQVYLNGVLLYRGSDYVATTGNTITGLTALVANDTIEVLSFVTAPIGDTYTQAAADAKFDTKVSSGLNLVIPASVTGGTLAANGQITFSGVSTVDVVNCFSSAYDTYRVLISAHVAAGSPLLALYFRDNNSLVGSGYYGGAYSSRFDGVNGATAINNAGFITAVPNIGNTAGSRSVVSLDVYRSATDGIVTGSAFNGNTSATVSISANRSAMTNFNGFTISPASSTFTGTIRIYGYNNGA
jgi:hypothetical protein